MTIRIRVQAADFDPGAELDALQAVPGTGAVANFLGIVRSKPDRPVAAMTLEHYPGMTERALEKMAASACARFELLACTIIHRVGRLSVGERIVLAAAASSHRQAALDGVSFLMDWLKTDAPFWKKEHAADGAEAWVRARESDLTAKARW